jgi:branched-chain amino acid transport system ATP-binding protein
MNFGGVFVFEDVSIEIPPGKVTACIGPNGAGKTTIINIVCGVFAKGRRHLC